MLTLLHGLLIESSPDRGPQATAPASKPQPTERKPVAPTRKSEDVFFHGKTERDAKRQALRYWSEHQRRLGMGLGEFTQQCVLLEDEQTIVFRRERAQSK